jgi:hypothetical protein
MAARPAVPDGYIHVELWEAAKDGCQYLYMQRAGGEVALETSCVNPRRTREVRPNCLGKTVRQLSSRRGASTLQKRH